MANIQWAGPSEWNEWTEWLATGLHGRNRWRLSILMSGALFAVGLRTVSSWFRAAGITVDYEAYYYFLSSVGRNAHRIGSRLLLLVLQQVPLPERVLLVIDDTPTKRYGPHVEGADIHHNPTPGPADQKYLYGHVWVTIALAIRHPLWGAMALPLQAMLYVRQRTLASIPSRRGWTFRTKLELAVQLVREATAAIQRAGKRVWIVVDGAYAKKPFLMPVLATRTVIVSRLRKDAHLRSLPAPPKRNQPKRLGRRPTYGPDRISLAKRAGQPRGWNTLTCTLYGKLTTKTFKTFLATYAPAGGIIRVVLVKEDTGWLALFCTAPEATAQDILEAFADRATIEQDFHDQKEVWQTGKQQVRNIWTNVGAFNLNLWMQTLVELWAWHRPHDQLTDRSNSPWDDPDRRPSHANRRKALRLLFIRNEISAATAARHVTRKLHALVQRLAQLAA